MKKTLGQRIREAREAAGLTQTELADKIGSEQTRISEIERGQHVPQIARLFLLADALGVTVDELRP